MPGKGHASPIIWNDRVFVVTCDQEKKERRLISLDASTGKTVWSKVVLESLLETKHNLNSYASPSPLIEDGRLYLHFGAYGNVCLDAENGELLWKNNQPELWVMHENGPGSSPILWENLMIFHLDGSDRQSVVALFKDSGKLAWQTEATRAGVKRSIPRALMLDNSVTWYLLLLLLLPLLLLLRRHERTPIVPAPCNNASSDSSS